MTDPNESPSELLTGLVKGLSAAVAGIALLAVAVILIVLIVCSVIIVFGWAFNA